MSQSDISSSVHALVAFIKEKTVSNISESRNLGAIALDDETLEKLVLLVESSVSQAFSLAYGSVQAAISNHEKD